MYRALLALGIGLLVATAAPADLRPPMGLKKVVIDYKITTDKEISDYTFYTVTPGSGKGAPGLKVTEVKFDPKTPIVFPGANRPGVAGRLGYVIAVPKNGAQTFATEKEFADAVQKGKVEGMAKTFNLESSDTVKDTETRDTIVKEYKFERFDGKLIILSRTGDTAPKPVEKKDSPDGEDDPPAGATAYTPRVGLWIAGVATTLSAMLGGLWLAGRTRRKV